MGGDGNICLQQLNDWRMFIFFRTVMGTLIRKSWIKRDDKGSSVWLLFCGCGFKVSWRGMARTRLIFFFRKWQLYPRSSGKFISRHCNDYWRNRQLNRCDANAVGRGWNGWCALCGQDGRRFSEDIGACLWVQFMWRSVSIWLLLRWTCASRKGRLWYNEFEY